MTDLFKQALNFVLRWEGGYVNDPRDLGGATNKGITQKVYDRWRESKGLGSVNVKNITDREVEEIYFRNYWQKAGCDNMTPKFAVICFDTAVNMGVSRVSEFLKEAEYKYPEKFLLARIKKYNEFAQSPSQRTFLHGWLNRVFALEEFIKTVS